MELPNVSRVCVGEVEVTSGTKLGVRGDPGPTEPAQEGDHEFPFPRPESRHFQKE